MTDWILALASTLSAIGVLGGILIARSQLHAWRMQALMQKKAEIAENILSAAYEIDDVMRSVRTPFEAIPEDKKDDKYFIYNEKLRRLGENVLPFQNLRRAQVRAKFFLQDTAVDKAVDQLFQARVDFRVAIQMTAEFVDNRPQTDESESLRREAFRDIYGTFSEKDKVHMSISNALQNLELRLGPYVRMNGIN